MRTFDITFDDLNEEAKQAFLDFQGLNNPEDGNFDIMPLAVVELEEDCLEQEE